MEETVDRKSLKMRYSRYKTMPISFSTEIQEENRLKFKINAEEAFTGKVTHQPKEEKAEPSKPLTSHDVKTSSEDSHKLSQKIEQLKVKLEQEQSLNVEHQKQMVRLQQIMEDREKIVKSQECQVADLKNMLEAKTKEVEMVKSELLVANKAIKQKEEKLFHIHETSKKELKVEVDVLQKKLKDMSIALENERDQNEKNKIKVSDLSKSIEDASKMEKQLEYFLSQETAKTKKLQEELEFVIKNVNDEKEELHQKFEEFKAATVVFLKSCDTHKDAVLRAVAEGNNLKPIVF